MKFVEVHNNANYRGSSLPKTAPVCNVRTYNLMTIISIDGQINGVCRGEQ